MLWGGAEGRKPHWFLFSSAQVTIVTYNRLGRLNNKHFFLAVQEFGKSMSKVLADWDPGEDSLSDL